PITIIKDLYIGAIGLKLQFVASVLDVEGIEPAKDIDNLLYNIEGDKINIAWVSSSKGILLKAGDVIFTIKARIKDINNNDLFKIYDESLIADEEGNKYGGKLISMPEIIITKNEFSVYAFPNPFKTKTNISFTIEEDSRINIKLFNIFGEEIKTLLDAFKTKGSHLLEIDLTNFAEGTYYYKIEASGINNYVRINKLLLVK
ncbi:MAG: T9SS type A sorting domain-containing protein, partial [Bacteroidales bacterium]|nr:T9SS type A sorting domain-containing protein [Bacteroidales bacterium]